MTGFSPTCFMTRKGRTSETYLADQLILDASSAGIAPHEIEEEYPDLIGVVAAAMEAAANAEAKRFSQEEG